MITGRIIANGVDLKSSYGAYVVDGGYVDLPCFPGMKDLEYNDWYEENGIEVDTSDPHVDIHDVRLSLRMRGTESDLLSFVSFIRSERFMDFEFVDVSRERTMRIDYVSVGDISNGLFKIDLILSDDDPRSGLSYQPLPVYYKNTGLTLDGLDVSAYGIVLSGSVDGLYPSISVKDNILAESDHIDGEVHYKGSDYSDEEDEKVTFDKDDISVRCVMRSNSMSSFWTKRDDLFLDLTKSGERVLSYGGVSARVYYKDCRSILFSYFNAMWWEFELTFGYIGEVGDEDI